LSKTNPIQRPITPYTIPSTTKNSSSVDPKSKGRSSTIVKYPSKYFSTSFLKNYLPSYPKESLTNSPKILLPLTLIDSIIFFLEHYIELYLEGSPIISQV